MWGGGGVGGEDLDVGGLCGDGRTLGGFCSP